MSVDTNIREMDNFTKTYKYYKQLRDPDKIGTVIDLDSVHEFQQQLKPTDKCLPDLFTHFQIAELGLTQLEKWKCYSLTEHPGTFIIKNPFTVDGQRMWLKRCLNTYPLTPNINNIKVVFNSENNPWTQLSQLTEENVRTCNLSKLHWVTLGYHHNWDTKIYDLENVSPFPGDLSELVECLVSRLGFVDFKSEAAIVNYYSTRSAIGGHTDHSEFDHEAPLVSISFGLTGVFLLGGTTKDVLPTAIFLRSGDVLVMSGASRLVYHAVPRVLSSDKSSWKGSQGPSSFENEKLDLYAKHFRVNLNVRQVFQYAAT